MDSPRSWDKLVAALYTAIRVLDVPGLKQKLCESTELVIPFQYCGNDMDNVLLKAVKFSKNDVICDSW